MIKRLLLTTVVLMSSIMTFAQIKVAILPATDKTGEVKYGLRLLLTSSITSAISLTEGYEAYDRIDLSSVMDEQTFQRTGMVSDTEIHKIGEMTGASFVLITEAAYIDESHVVATAKIVNVESAKIANSAVGMMDISNSEKLLSDCKGLTDKLLNGQTENVEKNEANVNLSSGNNKKINSNDEPPVSQSIVEDSQTNITNMSTVSKTTKASTPKIYNLNGNLYYQDTKRIITLEECSAVLNYDLFTQYKKAVNSYNRGAITIIIAAATIGAGAGVAIGGGLIGGDEDATLVGLGFMGVGTVLYIPGKMIQKNALKRIDAIVDKHNTSNISTSMLGISPALMLTAQNDIGVGVSFAFSF